MTNNRTLKSKRALVVSGGGSKGAYAVGVLKHLSKAAPLLKFNTFIGTSTGALIAPFMALDKVDLLETIYTTTKTHQVIKQKTNPPTFNQTSIYSTEPLKKLIDQYLADEDCEKLIRSRTKTICFLTACLQTKKLTVFTNRKMNHQKQHVCDVIQLIDGKHFKKAMLASANQPVFMPPIRVNKDHLKCEQKNMQYVDGGLSEYAGVEMAIDTGAEEVFTIYLSSDQKKKDKSSYSSIFKILGPTLGLLTNNIGAHDLRVPMTHNKALEYIDQVKSKLIALGVDQKTIDQAFDVKMENADFSFDKPIVHYLMRPSEPLKAGTNGLEFEPKDMIKMRDIGIQDAQSFLKNNDPVSLGWKSSDKEIV